MTTKTKIDLNRLNNETIEMQTLITQQLTNQEFYDMWADIGIKITQNEQIIKQGELQVKQAKIKNEINIKQKEEMTPLAKDCEARLPSKPVEKK